ncbi:YheC/YheD family protein [Polycladospora coralii]|nr:YheC/YheD family protein [Polycladospora coralii]
MQVPNSDSPLLLGVTVCYGKPNRKGLPFAEYPFFQQLSLFGKRMGIHVLVFNPREINWTKRTVSCWYFKTQGEWINAVFPLPAILYDRCYYYNTLHFRKYKPAIQRILQDEKIILLGRPLGGKLQTYNILKQNKNLIPFLPQTIRYTQPNDAIQFVHTHAAALIKPNGGSHGRGVVALIKEQNQYILKGRSIDNVDFKTTLNSEQELRAWLQQFIQTTKYIVQPFLSLYTQDERPFDVRILVQKNERKMWETTGIAVRTGKPTTITSNLHGGGEAEKFHTFLQRNYPTYLIENIVRTIRLVSIKTPQFIEENHGSLFELGIDVGIDRRGHIWILEVNSKPGRTVFIKTGEQHLRERAIQLPILYAQTLFNELKEGNYDIHYM